jgi:hypothetical protein
MKYLGSTLVLASLLIACGDEGSNPASPSSTANQLSSLQITTVQDLPADTARTGQYTYFNLRENTVVDPADSNSAKWDMAFKATTILTNGGSSGPGQGGGQVLEGADFESLAEAPESGYRADQPGDPAIPASSWYTYTGSEGNPPNAILMKPGVVLVLRTADNRYAKVQITSYYQGGAPVPAQGARARFYHFRYVFQPDGSRHFSP